MLFGIMSTLSDIPFAMSERHSKRYFSKKVITISREVEGVTRMLRLIYSELRCRWLRKTIGAGCASIPQ